MLSRCWRGFGSFVPASKVGGSAKVHAGGAFESNFVGIGKPGYEIPIRRRIPECSGGTAVRTRDTPNSSGEIVGARLLHQRDYIRTSVQSFSTGFLRELLQAMDARRRLRSVTPAKPQRVADMSISEMQREIVWRLQTLPPDDTDAIVGVVRRLLEHPQ